MLDFPKKGTGDFEVGEWGNEKKNQRNPVPKKKSSSKKLRICNEKSLKKGRHEKEEKRDKKKSTDTPPGRQ